MRALLVASAVLMGSCASPTVKEYEDRVERGRLRLAAMAKAEYERDRSNQDLLLIYASLVGGEASAEIDRVRGELGPFAAFLVGKAVLCGLPMEKWKVPPAEAAQDVLRALEKAAAHSSLVAFHKLQWLKVSTFGELRSWEECRSLLQDALTRDNWESPIRIFYLKWLTWLEGHEPDDLVRACSDLRVSDGHYLTLLSFARMMAAVHFAPVPPDPLVLEVSKLFQRVCERMQEKSTEAMDFKTAGVALQIILPARFLALWRAGDKSAAAKVSEVLDVQLDREARGTAFLRRHFKRYEAYPLFWRIGLDRMHEAFLPAIVAARRSSFDGTDREARRVLESGSEALLEGFRSLDSGGREFLKAWREDLGATVPILTRVLQTPPADPPSVNALRWALRDAAIIEGQPFPPDRQTELLNHAFGMATTDEERVAGREAYSWLLKEALLRPGSVPLEALISLRVSGLSDHMDRSIVVRLRGGRFDEADCQSGIESAKDYAFSIALNGYCRLLAIRAKEDRKAAAAMLPDYERGRFQDGWATIGETLRHVTGQDFGYDIDAWKKWLLTEPKD